MNWLWTALIVYIFACYGFVFYWLKQPCGAGDDLYFYYKAVQAKHPIRSRLLLALAFVFLSPIVVPYACFVCYRECRVESRKYRQLLRSHRSYAFIWLNPAKVPQPAKAYLDGCDAELLDEGFEPVGTYVMKTSVPDYYGRVHIHHTGAIVAGVCSMNGSAFFSFSSILESGRVLETTPISPSERLLAFEDNPRITAQFAVGENIAGTYRRHLEKLSTICDETGDRLLSFDPDSACDVLEYEGRVFSGELYALGDYDVPPPAPVLPAGRAVDAETVLQADSHA